MTTLRDLVAQIEHALAPMSCHISTTARQQTQGEVLRECLAYLTALSASDTQPLTDEAHCVISSTPCPVCGLLPHNTYRDRMAQQAQPVSDTQDEAAPRERTCEHGYAAAHTFPEAVGDGGPMGYVIQRCPGPAQENDCEG